MQFKKKVDRFLGAFCAAIMAILVVDVLWQVLSRFLSSIPALGIDPSSFTEELAGFLLVWVSLLGGAYATGQRMHLAIDLLPQRLSAERRRVLNKVINIFIFIFAVVILIIGGSRLVYVALKLNQLSAALEIPKGYVYMIVPLSGLFIVYYSLFEIFNGHKIDQEVEQAELAEASE